MQGWGLIPASFWVFSGTARLPFQNTKEEICCALVFYGSCSGDDSSGW